MEIVELESDESDEDSIDMALFNHQEEGKFANNQENQRLATFNDENMGLPSLRRNATFTNDFDDLGRNNLSNLHSVRTFANGFNFTSEAELKRIN